MSDNELLRGHVTRVGFDLTLGRTHIAALVYLAECIKQRRYINAHKAASAYAKTYSLFVPGIHGCQNRGLVVHHYNPDKPSTKGGTLKDHYTITKAGRLVIDLLKEAGIYQEYADALPRLEVVA